MLSRRLRTVLHHHVGYQCRNYLTMTLGRRSFSRITTISAKSEDMPTILGKYRRNAPFVFSSRPGLHSWWRQPSSFRYFHDFEIAISLAIFITAICDWCIWYLFLLMLMRDTHKNTATKLQYFTTTLNRDACSLRSYSRRNYHFHFRLKNWLLEALSIYVTFHFRRTFMLSLIIYNFKT